MAYIKDTEDVGKEMTAVESREKWSHNIKVNRQGLWFWKEVATAHNIKEGTERRDNAFDSPPTF